MDPNREPLRKIPTVHVPQVTPDIGARLKAKRESRGHSLDAVSQHTRIPKRFLEALEKNRLEEFPALVYLRGFLKGYCEYLELEFEPLWAMIQPRQPPAPAQPPAAAPSSKAAAEKPAPAAPRTTPPPAPKEAAPASGGGGATAAALVLAAALAVSVFIAMRKDPVGLPVHRPEAPRALAPLDTLAERRLSITFREDSWLSLRGDDVLLFEGRAPQGARQEWKAKNSFLLRSPHPRSLELQLDGKPYVLRPGPGDGYKIE